MPGHHQAVAETLAQIEAPHFRAGLVLWDGKVVDFAPILKHMKGWTRDRVRDYCRQQGWKPRIIWEMRRTDVGVRYLLGESENWPAVASGIVRRERARQANAGNVAPGVSLALPPQSG